MRLRARSFALAALALSTEKAHAHQLYLMQTTMGFQAHSAVTGASYLDVSPVGLTMEYAYFLSTPWSIRADGGVVFSSGLETVEMMGGGAGLAYSLMGGETQRLIRDDFHLISAPLNHLYLSLGFAERTYDLTAIVPAPKANATGTRIAVPRTGQFFAPEATLGYDTYLTWVEHELTLSARGRVLYSLNSPLYYDFTVFQLELGLGASF